MRLLWRPPERAPAELRLEPPSLSFGELLVGAAPAPEAEVPSRSFEIVNAGTSEINYMLLIRRDADGKRGERGERGDLADKVRTLGGVRERAELRGRLRRAEGCEDAALHRLDVAVGERAPVLSRGGAEEDRGEEPRRRIGAAARLEEGGDDGRVFDRHRDDTLGLGYRGGIHAAGRGERRERAAERLHRGATRAGRCAVSARTVACRAPASVVVPNFFRFRKLIGRADQSATGIPIEFTRSILVPNPPLSIWLRRRGGGRRR